MAGLDTFFTMAPAAARGARAGFTDIRNTLADVEAIDQQYRDNDERKLLQAGLSVPDAPTLAQQRAGLALSPNPLDTANRPLGGTALPLWQVPEAAPPPTNAVAPTARLDVPSTITEGDVIPAAPARVDAQTQTQQQRPTTAVQALQQWEAVNGPMPDAVRNKVYQNAQGKGASLTVPDYTPGGKSRVGEVDAGIPGYKVIDPNVAGWNRNAAMVQNQTAINTYRDNIRNKLATGDYGLAGNVFGSIKGYFTDTTQEAEKRTAIQGALDWFNSKEAVEYFNQNPNALPLANIDPVGFVDSFKKEANIRASRRGETVNEALTVPPVNLRDGKTSKIDPKFLENSTVVTNKRIVDLTNTMDAALQRPQTQQIIALAGQLQVDPAAALAVYGLETNYGSTSAESGKGASGPMQVMPATFNNIKKWFTNPENVKKYNLPEGTVSAARSMEFNTVNGKITGGLLVLKYNELIGNPKNLWGAGYQGNADAVLQQKRPLNAHDGNIMNADYNRAYVTLYNEALTRLGGGKPVAQAQAAAPVGKTIAIGDSLAEGFAKANKLDGSYKTGASPTAVLKMLQDYTAKNDIKGVTVYLGTGLPNNPAERTAVEQQVALIKSKGGIPVIFGTGPGTQKNPTTGQNDFLAQLAQSNSVEFTGRLADLYPSVAKDAMGLHLKPEQYQDLFKTRTQQIQVNNTGKTVTRPLEVNQVQVAQQDQRQPADTAVRVAGISNAPPDQSVPAPRTVKDEAMNQASRALTMTPAQHNYEVQQILRGREVSVQAYERAKGDAYGEYQDEFQRLSARRQMLATQAEAARKVGNVQSATKLLDQINTVDSEINKSKYKYLTAVNEFDNQIQTGLAGLDNNLSLALAYQGLNDLKYRNDPTRIERMWSQFSGSEIRVQPRSDGNYNLWVAVGGKLAPAGVYGIEDLSNKALEGIIPAWRDKLAAAQQAVKSEVFKTELEVYKNTKTEMAKLIGSLKVEDLKGQYGLIQEQLKQQGFTELKETQGPNGPMLYATSKDGMVIMQIDVNPPTISPDSKVKLEQVRIIPNPARAGLTQRQ